MAKQRVRPIHYIYLTHYTECHTVCNTENNAIPIENIMRRRHCTDNKGTFDVTKVTCSRCLKTDFYKEALDKSKHPLFFWKEQI